MTKEVIVLGGGLAGVSAAIKASDAGHKVRIIEGSSRLGGLLNGVRIKKMEFPLGTHFLRNGSSARLNEVLYGSDTKWTKLPYLKNGNITNGIIDTNTGFMNISNLPITTQTNYYLSILFKFIISAFSKPPNNEDFDLDLYLMHKHGKFIRNLYSSFSLKYFGISLHIQDINSLSPLLVTDRVKAFTPLISRYLKKLKYFDDRLSYHYSSEGSIPFSSFIPESFHYSTWWENVAKKLESINILITYRSKCFLSEDKTNIIVVDKDNNKEQLSFDSYQIIDTVGIQRTKNDDVHTTLFFYQSSCAPLVDSYFITSYSIDCCFSRVTLCSNIVPTHSGLVVELIHPKQKYIDVDSFNDQVYHYLIRSRVFGLTTRFEFLKQLNLKGGGFRPKKIELNDNLVTSELTETGIANGKQWFMNEVSR